MSEELKIEPVAGPKTGRTPKERKPLKPSTTKRTGPSPSKASSPERIKLWIALTSLVAAIAVGVVSVYQSYLQTARLQDVTVAIRDTEDIRSALQKPLEGVWHYKLVFSRFFGQDSTYVGMGTAIFLWEPPKRQYQVYIGYSISKEWSQEKLVTAFLTGTVQADEMGWPQQEFEMPMQYLERTGVGEFASPLAPGFTFTGGKYKKSADGKRAEQVFAHYQNRRSTGEMILYK
jgi:hypothetical protein